LPQHLTLDNLNTTIGASSAILEMNFDHMYQQCINFSTVFFLKFFSLENEAFAKNCPISISEVAGVRGTWLTCVSTRLRSESDEKSSQIVNGDDFVTIHNSAGSIKFEMKLAAALLQRFKPDLIMVPFDEHQIPISAKRIKRAVDRNAKYENIFADTCKDLSIPFISSVSGAEVLSERDRSVQNANQMSSGFAYCDLNAFDFEKKLELLKSSKISESSFRIIRGSISPEQAVKLICFTDAFDSSFVDDITAKGMALQLEFPGFSSFKENELAELASKDILNLWDEKYFEDFSPVSQICLCPCCTNYKRSYIHHLLKSHEMLAGVLLMMHNLHQYNNWIIFLRSLE
jgi:tRNA-guanine family transglycosylase